VDPVLPEWRVPLPEVAHVERHRTRDAANGEIAGQAELVLTEHLDRGAYEGDLGMMLGIQEIGASQVCVPVGLPGAHPRGVELGAQPAGGRVARIELQLAAHVPEVTPYPRDHHVTGSELSCRVTGLELPSHALTPF